MFSSRAIKNELIDCFETQVNFQRRKAKKLYKAYTKKEPVAPPGFQMAS